MGLLDKLQIRQETDEEVDGEIEPQLPQDPEPGVRGPAGRRGKAPAKVAPASKTSITRMANQVAEDLTSLLEMGAAVWGMTDDCCAPVLEQQAAPMAKAFTAILAKNPRLLSAFGSTDIVAYTVGLAALYKATAPVVKAVYRNHVSGAVEDGEEAQDHAGADRIRLADFPAHIPRFSA